MVGVSLALAHCREEEVNTVVSSRDTRTPLHLAAALGHLAIAQILIWVSITRPKYESFYIYFVN
jgi:hypothetical protein